MLYACVTTPFGRMLVARSQAGYQRIAFVSLGATSLAGWVESPEACRDAVEQLGEYFAGRRRSFDLPLAAEGTPFQRAVWDELHRIPHGTTASYGEVARRIGRPGAARAVGAANHANPLAVVVPCHRVVGSTGKLVGYAGGIHLKQALLDLERATAAG
jgi:methylated-DNA-[protein]-cysteine S-methyltransferase